MNQETIAINENASSSDSELDDVKSSGSNEGNGKYPISFWNHFVIEFCRMVL